MYILLIKNKVIKIMKKVLFISTILSITTFQLAFAEKDAIIASVNGEKIYNSEMSRHLEEIPDFDQLPDEQKHLVETKITEALTKLKAVVQEAEKLKIDETEDFKDKLSDYKQQLMYTTLLEHHIDNFLTEKRLKEYYNKHKSNYEEEKAHASHILLESKEKAMEIIQKLKAGEDFDKLAKEFSTGPSATNGGDLGWFTKENMVPEFSEATFKLKEKTFTEEPVQTQFGWHVIFLKEKMSGVPRLFEDVKEEISQELMQTELESYVDSITEKAEIVINDKN